MLALRRLPSLARAAARPQIASLGTTGACKEKQLPWQLVRAPRGLSSPEFKAVEYPRDPPYYTQSRGPQRRSFVHNTFEARRRDQSIRPDAIDVDYRRSRRAPTPSRASRRRSRAARRSRRTSTSATRRPRPSTSARPSSRPSVWRTRRRPSRRSLAKNWRRCCTRSTWPSARRRCASRREKFDPPIPPSV